MSKKSDESITKSGTGSGSNVSDEESDSSIDMNEIVTREPMFHVLGQFLENSDGVNVSDILTSLVAELKMLNAETKNIRRLYQRAQEPEVKK